MNHYRTISSLIAFVAVVPFLVPAMSHMTIDPEMAPPDSSATFYLKISHDCGDATTGTSNFTVIPPPGLLNVKSEQVEGWRVEFEIEELDPPIVRGTRTYNETVTRISYLGFLPDRMWRKFGMSAITPKDEGLLYFEGYQDCHGEEDDIAWTAIPTEADPDPKRPAAVLNITMAAEEE